MNSYQDEHDYYDHPIDLKLWRRIIARARPYRTPLGGLALAGMVVAVADVLLPWITAAVIDDAVTAGGERIWTYGSIYVALALIMASMVWVFIVLTGIVATGVAYDLRHAGFRRLQELSFSFYDKRPVGWLMARMTSDCARISGILPWALLDVVWGVFLLSGITAMMFWMNWRLALVVLAIVPPLSVVTVIYQRKLIRAQRSARRTNSKITAGFNEGIVGVRTTRALVREEENLKEFEVLTRQMSRYSLRSALHAAVYLPIVMTLGALGMGLALWRGGLLTGNVLGLGELVAFIQYAGLFHIPIQEMAERFTNVQEAQASAERLQGLLDTEPEIDDSPEVRAALELQVRKPQAGRAIDGGQDSISEIHVDHVHFAYIKEEPVLTDVDFRVRAGESIALVGETGSGKSTIASLMCRFYEPTGGAIRIDGVDYRRRSLHWLQSNLGMVLQEPHLFSGTIRDNIRYGRLGASNDEVHAAARHVGADAFITELPDGYDTEVGEGGDRLSTGQKQFVSLARAVLADPQILVLDEATSSLDTETERRIQKGIEAVLEGRISLVIAHRLSTIRAADRILVIDGGRVIEEGNHAALLARQGAYAELYSRQFHRDAETAALGSAAQTRETE